MVILLKICIKKMLNPKSSVLRLIGVEDHVIFRGLMQLLFNVMLKRLGNKLHMRSKSRQPDILLTQTNIKCVGTYVCER